MSLITEAFSELYPNQTLDREVSLKYSGKFKPYNANVKHSRLFLHFKLSREWKTVSREIQIGLIQSLLIKVYRQPAKTSNLELYESFVKNLSRFVPKTKSDPILEQSFSRVNEKYFNSMLDLPNMAWGSGSTSKLGMYSYQTDTITLSLILKDAKQELRDYVMYHEMLHKKHKFYTKSGRSYHHTATFRNAEKKFENQEVIEKELAALCRKAKLRQCLNPRKEKGFLSWLLDLYDL